MLIFIAFNGKSLEVAVEATTRQEIIGNVFLEARQP